MKYIILLIILLTATASAQECVQYPDVQPVQIGEITLYPVGKYKSSPIQAPFGSVATNGEYDFIFKEHGSITMDNAGMSLINVDVKQKCRDIVTEIPTEILNKPVEPPVKEVTTYTNIPVPIWATQTTLNRYHISQETYNSALKDLEITKSKSFDGRVTTYTTKITPKKNLWTLSYGEVLPTGAVVVTKDLKNIQKSNQQSFVFELDGEPDDPQSIIFNKQLNHGDIYTVVISLMFIILFYITQKEKKHNTIYMFFFAAIMNYTLTPILDIFTLQFLATTSLLTYSAWLWWSTS